MQLVILKKIIDEQQAHFQWSLTKNKVLGMRAGPRLVATVKSFLPREGWEENTSVTTCSGKLCLH